MMNQYQAGYVQAQLDGIKDLIRSINATLDRIDVKLDRAAKKIAVVAFAFAFSGCSYIAHSDPMRSYNQVAVPEWDCQSSPFSQHFDAMLGLAGIGTAMKLKADSKIDGIPAVSMGLVSLGASALSFEHGQRKVRECWDERFALKAHLATQADSGRADALRAAFEADAPSRHARLKAMSDDDLNAYIDSLEAKYPVRSTRD